MHVYRPLRDPEQVRLLLLQPEHRSKDGHIHVSLSRYKLSKAPPYEALSYVWGQRSQTMQITTNNTPMEVTRNLYDALLRLRHQNQPRMLWIDAICINQQDTTEKSSQVSQMRAIYSKAKRVILWVGEEDEFSAQTFAVLEHYADHSQRYKVVFIRTLEKDPLGDTLSRFLDRPYFSRSWITQEVVSSRRAVVMCGSFQICFDRMWYVLFLMAVSYRSDFWDLLHPFFYLWSLRCDLMKNSDEVENLDLINLLMAERTKQAEDPRDKVFALLGIANPVGKIPLKVDYSEGTEELYISVARQILQNSCHLGILSAVQARHMSMDLPSWVADWSQPWHGGIYSSRKGCFQASGTSKPRLIKVSESRAICLRGLRLDSVRNLGDTSLHERPPDTATPLVNEERLKADIARLGLHGNYPVTREPYLHVYLSVITAGGSRFPRAEFPRSPDTYFCCPGPAPFRSNWHNISSKLIWLYDEFEIFFSTKGFLGLGPRNMQPGDVVCILLGGEVCFILRPIVRDKYILIGECYVHGWMHGEAMKSRQVTRENFLIV